MFLIKPILAFHLFLSCAAFRAAGHDHHVQAIVYHFQALSNIYWDSTNIDGRVQSSLKQHSYRALVHDFYCYQSLTWSTITRLQRSGLSFIPSCRFAI